MEKDGLRDLFATKGDESDLIEGQGAHPIAVDDLGEIGSNIGQSQVKVARQLLISRGDQDWHIEELGDLSQHLFHFFLAVGYVAVDHHETNTTLTDKKIYIRQQARERWPSSQLPAAETGCKGFQLTFGSRS